MEDTQILELYFARSEDAIRETHRKYGAHCRSVALQILNSREDSEECVNDTYLRAWNTIPPRRPNPLRPFLSKITRNLALDRYNQYNTAKRGRGQVPASLEELAECVPDPQTPETALELRELVRALNGFLATLSPDQRKIFLRRYWSLSSVAEISQFYGVTESKVKTTLMRTRRRLRAYLEKEGIML